MNKITTALIWVLLIVLFASGISHWKPWQRETRVFYQPILPLETIRGDIVVLEDSFQLVIDEDKRINSIRYNNGTVTINTTVHRSLWQLITE